MVRQVLRSASGQPKRPVTELLSFRKENHRHTFVFNKKTKSSTYTLCCINYYSNQEKGAHRSKVCPFTRFVTWKNINVDLHKVQLASCQWDWTGLDGTALPVAPPRRCSGLTDLAKRVQSILVVDATLATSYLLEGARGLASQPFWPLATGTY